MVTPLTTSTAQASGLSLRTRGSLLEILSGHVVLLSNAALETELLFGGLAGALAPPTKAPQKGARVLVGGLGFGATVRGALDASPAVERVVVAEKVAAVADLVADRLAHVAGRPLDDPRVTVLTDDAGDVMARQDAAWDVILLDVDNGPHWASFRTNARLYTPAGLASARRALAPGGSLAVWSGYPADGFLAALRRAGFAARCVPLLERGRVRARAYVGTRPD